MLYSEDIKLQNFIINKNNIDLENWVKDTKM